MIRGILRWRADAVLAGSAILIATIAVVDWRVEFNATLGFLYIFPMVLLGTVLSWWQLLLVAVGCTYLSDRLDPFPMDSEYARDTLIYLTLVITGLLSQAVTKGFRREMESMARLEKEGAARRAAEEQLEFLIQSSPAQSSQ
jgi:hypothetical protein